MCMKFKHKSKEHAKQVRDTAVQRSKAGLDYKTIILTWTEEVGLIKWGQTWTCWLTNKTICVANKQSKKKNCVARLKSWMQTVFIHSTELDIFCIEDGLKCQYLYKASKSMKTFFSFQRHCWNYTIQNKLTLLGEKSQMCVFTFLLQ